MNESTATLSNLRQSPRKVRLVANLVRGKKVADAVLTLQFADKRASLPIRKLIVSALDNAKAQSVDTDDFIVKSIEVNAGKTLMRRRPVAHGSAHPIRKRTSQIYVVLGTKMDMKASKVVASAPVAEVKKTKAPKVATKTVKVKAKK